MLRDVPTVIILHKNCFSTNVIWSSLVLIVSVSSTAPKNITLATSHSVWWLFSSAPLHHSVFDRTQELLFWSGWVVTTIYSGWVVYNSLLVNIVVCLEHCVLALQNVEAHTTQSTGNYFFQPRYDSKVWWSDWDKSCQSRIMVAKRFGSTTLDPFWSVYELLIQIVHKERVTYT